MTEAGNQEVDLRPWGWAPGEYIFRCRDCPDDMSIADKMSRLGDKRSWRCKEHAEAARAVMTEARVPVTVEDREAAAVIAHSFSRHIMESSFRTGKLDHHEIVQRIARHRLAGVAAGREEAAKVCDDLTTTAANIQAALELVGSEAPTKAIQRETAEALAAAIRQMGGE